MKRGQAGGLAVKAKYGPDHFRELGRKGFEVTTEKYFGGDRRAHVRWLHRKGCFEIDKSVTYGRIYADPGPHPAHKAMIDWLEDTERNIP